MNQFTRLELITINKALAEKYARLLQGSMTRPETVQALHQLIGKISEVVLAPDQKKEDKKGD